MKSGYFFQTKIGKIWILENGIQITDTFLSKQDILPDIKITKTTLLQNAANQLYEYFAGERMVFDLPLKPNGTPFEQRVWNVLREIPYGETRSYKQVAESIGNARATRAVGMANHRNPIMIFIPCHRVIGADGSLTGYGGGIEIKKALLNLEKSSIRLG